MNVDAPRLAMVDLTAYHSGVSVCFHLKPCDPIPVDITALKIALQRETERRFTLAQMDKVSMNEQMFGIFTMPWSKVNTPTSLPWWI